MYSIAAGYLVRVYSGGTRMVKSIKIHINLSDETHRKLRVLCAADDLTIQQFVEGLIQDAVKDVDPLAIKKNEAHAGERRG